MSNDRFLYIYGIILSILFVCLSSSALVSQQTTTWAEGHARASWRPGDAVSSPPQRAPALNSSGPNSCSNQMLALMEAGKIAPGNGVIYINYMGKPYSADLLDDGTLRYNGLSFKSVSLWSLHVMQGINPSGRRTSQNLSFTGVFSGFLQ